MYQLGQVRLDMALELELSPKDKAAYMINTFEHVNKALRFKYNTNMSRAEYN
jgi:hypothetical protein